MCPPESYTWFHQVAYITRSFVQVSRIMLNFFSYAAFAVQFVISTGLPLERVLGFPSLFTVKSGFLSASVSSRRTPLVNSLPPETTEILTAWNCAVPDTTFKLENLWALPSSGSANVVLFELELLFSTRRLIGAISTSGIWCCVVWIN